MIKKNDRIHQPKQNLEAKNHFANKLIKRKISLLTMKTNKNLKQIKEGCNSPTKHPLKVEKNTVGIQNGTGS